MLWPIFSRGVRQREEERLENSLEELCCYSPVLVPLFIVIRRRETCSPSNTKSIRKDLLDPKGFILYIYLGFTQSHIDKNICHNNILILSGTFVLFLRMLINPLQFRHKITFKVGHKWNQIFYRLY